MTPADLVTVETETRDGWQPAPSLTYPGRSVPRDVAEVRVARRLWAGRQYRLVAVDLNPQSA